jgi:hypothetical protein
VADPIEKTLFAAADEMRGAMDPGEEFASSEGKRGGEFYTPKSIVSVLVERLEPTHGRVQSNHPDLQSAENVPGSRASARGY